MRYNSNGHVIYSDALFNYLLVPLILITRDPVAITSFFALLNIFTGLLVYRVGKSIFGNGVGILSAAIFLFNDFMIYHSLFIWIYNFLPLIGILTTYYLYLFIKERRIVHAFVLGILNGVGIGLQILFAPFALIVMAVVLYKNNKKLLSGASYIAGILIANLTIVIFDLRHNFYHVKTLLLYTLDTLQGKSNASFAYYYLLPLWPVFAVFAGVMLFKIFKHNRANCYLVLAIYILLNIISPRVNFKSPTGMPEGLTTPDIDAASLKIADDAGNGNFNVAEVLDFDKRAYVLRYFVEYKYGKKPGDVTEYPNIKLLYVLGRAGYNFSQADVWEVKSGWPYNTTILTDVGRGYVIYKLTK